MGTAAKTDIDAAYPHLMSAGTIAGVPLRNRVVQAPMGSGLMRDGRVTAADVAFIEARARGGVGLIITGAGPVHETSIVAGRILTEAWDEAGQEALRARVDAVHAHGTKIFGQILHLGRESSGETQAGGATEYVPLAPSSVPSPRDPSPPHEMSREEIRMLIEAYARVRRQLSRRRLRRPRDTGLPRIPCQPVPGIWFQSPDRRVWRSQTSETDPLLGGGDRGSACRLRP